MTGSNHQEIKEPQDPGETCIVILLRKQHASFHDVSLFGNQSSILLRKLHSLA